MKSIIFVALLFVGIACSEYLEYEKVRLVDTYTFTDGSSNYLFRGNEPKISVNGQDEFAYDLLTSYMRNVSQLNGVTLPENFLIFDIKLTYGLKEEQGDVNLEQWFFGNNTDKGLFGVNITLGDVTDPNLIEESVRDEMAKYLPVWQKDNLPFRMNYYREILTTQQQQPLALYIHCECGCDRTGEIFASYVMQYLNYSFQKAMDWDYSVAMRPIMPNHQWAAQWYCLYLQLAVAQDIDYYDYNHAYRINAEIARHSGTQLKKAAFDREVLEYEANSKYNLSVNPDYVQKEGQYYEDSKKTDPQSSTNVMAYIYTIKQRNSEFPSPCISSTKFSCTNLIDKQFVPNISQILKL
ncbi:hypothetical protein PPL_05050 [Heterostelium album PN500]|uniref:Tyrosine specific protein phosphatases domain-containing protein n=1 Tax=Heterostelium pallidum (strain ATCC 26659 / Pp 5 / PN500) TaxID=670386 RepID=D3B9A6_HETP5|nr:hypothetical protein PPL_05050 [Heterostelium album PN500]EFA81818.1 hypothetical protein PPL_05050 [Heterostelium album PN500]|eukprot:XP_020433935.1 hypothetical protein PPL_05050 [Heterostelium album PN500]